MYVDTDQHSFGEFEHSEQTMSGPSMWNNLRAWRIAAIANLVLVLALGGFTLLPDNNPETDEMEVVQETHLIVESRPGEYWKLTTSRVQVDPDDRDVRFLELLSGVTLWSGMQSG